MRYHDTIATSRTQKCISKHHQPRPTALSFNCFEISISTMGNAANKAPGCAQGGSRRSGNRKPTGGKRGSTGRSGGHPDSAIRRERGGGNRWPGRSAQSARPRGGSGPALSMRGRRGGTSAPSTTHASSPHQTVASRPGSSHALDWPHVSPEHNHHMQRGRARYDSTSAVSGQPPRSEASSHGSDLPHSAFFESLPSWYTPKAQTLQSIPIEPQPPTWLAPPAAGIPAIPDPATSFEENTGEVSSVLDSNSAEMELLPLEVLPPNHATSPRSSPQPTMVNTVVDGFQYQDELYRS